MSNQVHVITLVWDQMFNDSDEGSSFAGEGRRLLAVHKQKETADKLASELNPILKLAEDETIVFPVQKNNRILKEKIGATLHDIDSDGEDFRVVVETFDLQ